MGHPLRLTVALALAPLALAACGSSGPSAEEAAELVEKSQHIGLVKCEKQGGERIFRCTGLSGNEEVRLQATVSESGKSVTVVRCPGSTSSNTSGCEGRR